MRALQLRFCDVERSGDIPQRGRSVPSRDSSTSLGMTEALEEQHFGGAIFLRASYVPQYRRRHFFRRALFQDEDSGRLEHVGQLGTFEQKLSEFSARLCFFVGRVGEDNPERLRVLSRAQKGEHVL